MRPLLKAVLVPTAVVLAGNTAVAAEPTSPRSEVAQLPGGARVKVVRGPAIDRQAEAPTPAPAPERTIVAAGGRTLWLLEDDSLTACFVWKTSYVDGYQIRCLEY
jgi:hypothetical protein